MLTGNISQVTKPVGFRHVGFIRLMTKPRLRILKRRRQVEYRASMLNGNDTACRKTAAVARAINLVDDRRIHVSASQEVGVQ